MILTDGKQYADITIRTWNDAAQCYSPDWSNHFYDAGNLNHHHEIEYDYDNVSTAFNVDDIDYCIEQAMDMANGRGDYDEPSQDVDVDVKWLQGVQVLPDV